ncbi:hypothetical protein INT47_003374 [Mucor saturninus]|uniref:Uncharacterized protein n=1 Tax=Mucor saturninus TaxID=64648 RepID=A0A8H7REG5_9FUNG|nr:hypothetical protein INT47_003374 [Mucor saturninus]
MNNTEANNNTPNNIRGRGRGRGRVVEMDVEHNTTPVNNSNAQTDNTIPENNNADVEDDNEPSRPYVVWPEVANCILLEITAGTYSHLLKRGDTTFKQFIWGFVADVTQVTRETGVGGTVPNVPYYEEIAKITQDNPSIQPEVIYESINMEENGIRSYRRSNDIDLMNTIGSDGPETTYLTPTEVDQLVIQKALADRYPTEESVDTEGYPILPSSTAPTLIPPTPISAPPPASTTPTSTPTDPRPAGPTPTELVIAVDKTEAVWRSSLKRSIEALEVDLKEKEREVQNIKKKKVSKEQL